MRVLNTKNIYNTIYQSFKPYLWTAGSVIILGFIGRFILLSTTRYLAVEVDTLNQTKAPLDSLFIGSLLSTLAPVIVLSFILIMIFRVTFSRLCSRAVSRLYDETTLRVSRFNMDFFDQRPVGEIATRFSSDYGNIFRLFGGPLAEFLSIGFDLLSLVLIASWINPLFCFPLVMSFFIFYFLFKKNQESLRKIRSTVSSLRGPAISHFSETIQGAVNIKLNHKSDDFLQRFQTLDQKYIDSKILALNKIMSFTTQLNISSFVLFLVNGLLALFLVSHDKIGIAQASLILSYSILLTQGLQMFFEWFSQFDEALIGVQRMDEYLRHPLEPMAVLPKMAHFETGHKIISKEEELQLAKPLPENSEIEIRNLTLTYPTLSHPTLNDLSITIKPGEKIGLIGRTGSGKSSLVSALLKLYSFSGEIIIDQKKDLGLQAYRQYFSVVSQDSLFLKGTLRSNLDLGGLVNDETILKLLSEVGLKYPLSFQIEEGGKNLSFGEKQLICLARSLIKASPIVIFDEATAHIDHETEKHLEEVFTRLLKNKTQIIVAHRLETVKRCDRLVWMEHGQIKKQGNVQEVLEAFNTSG
jgi:ABC-type multidrug transport system fused ATPase/permease subunit